jgi:hypothetical protein
MLPICRCQKEASDFGLLTCGKILARPWIKDDITVYIVNDQPDINGGTIFLSLLIHAMNWRCFC